MNKPIDSNLGGMWEHCLAKAKAIVAAHRDQLPVGFDPQASIVSGTVGGILGADAQKDATDANRHNTQETNNLNFQQFLRSRGSTGDAVLPMYLRNKDGKKFEAANLGPQLIEAFDASLDGTPKNMVNRLKRTQAKYTPMRDAAFDKAGAIFDGRIGDMLLEDHEPVAAAREALGQKRTAFRRQASIDALSKTLANIEAVQAGKGYSGDSLSKRMMEFSARKAQADDESEARLLEDSDRLTTAMERRDINDYANVQLPLSSINLPAELMGQDVRLQSLPQREMLDFMSARMNPLTFLRIGAGQPFQHMPMPLVSPVSSPWQLMAQGAGQAGNMVADYYMKQDLARQAQARQTYTPRATVQPSLGYTPMSSPAAVPQANTWDGPNYDAWSYLGLLGGGNGTGDYMGDVNPGQYNQFAGQV